MPSRPPDRGSFPLDHFKECTDEHNQYMSCLKEHSFDNMSCRFLSKAYLKCRMANELMKKDDMRNLGFTEKDNGPKPPRENIPIVGIKEQFLFEAGREYIMGKSFFWPSYFGFQDYGLTIKYTWRWIKRKYRATKAWTKEAWDEWRE